MRRGGRRARLGEEQGAHEERVIGQLDDPDLAVETEPAHAKPSRLQRVPVVLGDAVVAVEILERLRAAVELRGARAGKDPDWMLLTHQRARDRGDDQSLAVRFRLGVIGVLDPQDIARELDDRVLEAPSGADEGHAPLPGVADGRERAVHAPVGAGGGDPEAGGPGEARGG